MKLFQYSEQTYQENLLEDQTEFKQKYQSQFKLVKVFYAHCGRVDICELNNNENMFITHGYDSKCKLWDRLTGKMVVSLQINVLNCSAFNHPFCDHIATISYEAVAKNFDLTTRQCLILVGHVLLVNCIQFHPNFEFIATGSYDQTARLCNGSTGEQIQIFNGHIGTIKSVNFNSDGDRLVTFSYDKTARIWDVESGNCIKILGGREFAVECIELDNTGNYCVTGTTDQTCKIWNVKSGQCIKTFTVYKSKIQSLFFNSTRNRIVTVFNDGICKIHDVQTGKVISELIANKNGVVRGHYFGQKNQIIAIGFCATAMIYSEAGEYLQKLGRDIHQITSYSLSQKGNVLISASIIGSCQIWKNVNN